MNTIQNNDFMILNSIIYKIHTSSDFLDMRKNLLVQLKMILDFDSADFHLSKGDGSTSLTSRVGYNCAFASFQEYENSDYSRGILETGKSMIYRESDIMSEAKRIETEYYKKVYLVNNWHHSLQLILAYEGQFLGVVTFYKTKGKEDFQYSDIFLLDMLKEHLAYRIYIETVQKKGSNQKLSIYQATEKFGLTKREREILEMMMQGLDNKTICVDAIISNNTLKKHILNIYKKMEIKNRVQLFKLIKEYNPKVL